jgi:hypothetical protein
MSEKLLKASEVAERLCVREDKVYELIASGRVVNGRTVKLPAVNLGTTGRATWRFNAVDVEQFIQAVRVNEQLALPAPSRGVPLELTRDWLA